MGREKARKPKKQPTWRRPGSLQDLLSGFTAESVWRLALAAGRSPATRRRWASIAHLAVVAARQRQHGTRVAGATDLPALLDAVRLDLPQLQYTEDYLPTDPRLVVEVAAFDRLLRLFPGCVERPVADVERMLALAPLLDDAVRRRHGFAVSDLVEAVLSHVDAVLAAAAPSWPDADPGDPAVSAAELDVLEPALEPRTPAHRAALAWATAPALALQYRPSDGDSVVGHVVRVVPPGSSQATWLPLAVLPEALARGVSLLAAEAGSDPDVRRRFAQHVAARTRRRLWRFGDVLYGAPDREDGPAAVPGDVVQWLLPVAHDRMVAVQQYAGLVLSQHPEHDLAVARVAREVVGANGAVRIPFPGGHLDVAAGTQVVPVLVAARAGHLVAMGDPAVLHLSMEDLDWIAATAGDETDLYHFAVDMTRAGGPERILFETIDAWEPWREQGGTLVRGGLAPKTVLFETHRSDAEWERAAGLTPIERALVALRLPPLRDWDGVDLLEDGTAHLVAWPEQPGGAVPDLAHVHRRPPILGSTVLPGRTPVAFSADLANVSDPGHRELLLRVTRALALTVPVVEREWTAAAISAGRRAARIEVTTTDIDPSSVHVGAVIVARAPVDLRAWIEQIDADPAAGRTLLADLIGAVLERAGAAPDSCAALRAAWSAAPPTLSVRVGTARTARHRLPAPIAIERPLEAATDRASAVAARRSGVTPGRYEPATAKQIDLEVLAPAALQLLDDRLRQHDRDEVVRFGMEQIERIMAEQSEQTLELQHRAEVFGPATDAAGEHLASGRRHHRLRRCAEAAVERALLVGGPGPAGEAVSGRDWAEILAAAAGYIDATTRSETLHYQLASSGLEVTDQFDLRLVDWPRSPEDAVKFDADAFSAAESRERLHGSLLEPDDDPVLSRLYRTADDAFADAYGTRVADLSAVLLALAALPLEDGEPDAVMRTPEQLADWIAQSVAFDSGGGPDRARAALTFLTAGTAEYAREDWSPWKLRSRAVRLPTRPLPRRSDGRVLVAPHFCLAALQIMTGYWRTGELPWSQSLPKPLETALAAVRSRRNRQLEDQIDGVLQHGGWSTISRIKVGDAARLGVAEVTTEIDLVVGRPGSHWIDLLEVKDPAPTFVPADIRRQLRRFFEGRTCYSAQLRRKDGELRPFAAAIAHELGLPDRPDYALRTWFVTHREVPAAYAGSPFPFVTAAELHGRLLPR